MAINFAAAPPPIPVNRTGATSPGAATAGWRANHREAGNGLAESELRTGEELASVWEERRPPRLADWRSRAEEDGDDDTTAVGGQVDILV